MNDTDTEATKYATVLQPGCYEHSHLGSPIISIHTTPEAAERKARSSDRLMAVEVQASVCHGDRVIDPKPFCKIPPQGGDHGQAGRYGRSLRQ